MSAPGSDFHLSVKCLQAAVSEQDFVSATEHFLAFRDSFAENWAAVCHDKAESQQLLETGLEAARSALQICSVHRQMLSELLQRASASNSYYESGREQSQNWQTDL